MSTLQNGPCYLHTRKKKSISPRHRQFLAWSLQRQEVRVELRFGRVQADKQERWKGKLKEMWELSVAHTGVTTPAVQLALAGEQGAALMMGLVWKVERRGKRAQWAVKEQQLERHNSHQEVKEREHTRGRLPWSIALRTMVRSRKIRGEKGGFHLTRKEKKKRKKWAACYWSTSMIITRDKISSRQDLSCITTKHSYLSQVWASRKILTPCLKFVGTLNSLWGFFGDVCCFFGLGVCGVFLVLLVCLFTFSFKWLPFRYVSS